LRERDADALQRGHTLDRVVQRLPQLDRALRHVLPERGRHVREDLRRLVEDVVPLPASLRTFVNVSSMFSPD
jgi:hypothetical protein